jgi:hypothetical protein
MQVVNLSFTMNAIVKAIMAAKISPSAREEAARLTDAWIQQFSEFDAQFKTLYVEVPWFYWADKNTLVVGVMDLIIQDKIGILGSEHKTVKEPKKNKDGEDSQWWNEERWLEQISNTPQLSFYALAMLKGSFVTDAKKGTTKVLNVHNPRILVRAAVKANQPRFWPTDPSNGVFQFPDLYLDKIVHPAIIARAHAIRAMRASGKIPWALPGFQCENKFHKLCPYYDEFCLPHKHPKSGAMLFDSNDPGYVAIKYAGVDIHPDHPNHAYDPNPDLVIFSASSYQTDLQCSERYRILTTIGGGEETAELEIGQGLHSGIAQFYREQMNPSPKRRI